MPQRRPQRKDRPAKPYPDFPLFPHATKRWAKKIKGKFVFFGPWADAEGALQRYLEQRDQLYAGVPPAPVRLPPPPVRKAPVRAVGPTLAPVAKKAGSAGVAPRDADDAARGDDAEGTAVDAIADAELLAERPTGTIAKGTALTIRDLVNAYLTAKRRKVDAGEMGLRSFSEQHATAGRLVKYLGKDRRVADISIDDFARLRAKLAETRAAIALGNEIGRVRSVFKYGYEAGLMDRTMRFGPEFRKPSKKSVRIARRESGPKMFEPDEIAALLEQAGPQMKAMILLGLNAGLGNTDVGELSKSHVNLKGAMLEFPRSKTGIARRCVLWPETVAALREVTKVRPQPKSAGDKNLIFVTKQHHRWVRVTEPGARSQGKNQAVVKDAVAAEFTKTAKNAGVLKNRRGFYALRHTFRTVADEVGDRRAIDLIMGHENGADIATAYVERIDDERLRKVTEHVRGWVFQIA